MGEAAENLEEVKQEKENKFTSKDLLKREKAVDFLFDRICNSENEGNNTIALKGDFGTGKTYFLNMVQEKLKEEKIQHVYFDAWENEKIANPLISFTSLLTNKILKSKRTKIKNKVKKIGNFIKPVASKAAFVGAELETAGSTKGVAGVAASKTTDKLIDAIFCGEAQKSINDFRKELSISLDKKTVILIDELDRCKPDYAIEVFETIKHFFKNDSNKDNLPGLDNLVFVIAMNSTSLKEAVSAVYSDKVAEMDYVSKFIDFEMNLPKVQDQREYIRSIAFCDSSEIKPHKFYLMNNFSSDFHLLLEQVHNLIPNINLRKLKQIIGYSQILCENKLIKEHSFLSSLIIILYFFDKENLAIIFAPESRKQRLSIIQKYTRGITSRFNEKIEFEVMDIKNLNSEIYSNDIKTYNKFTSFINYYFESYDSIGNCSYMIDNENGYYKNINSMNLQNAIKIYNTIENISEFMG